MSTQVPIYIDILGRLLKNKAHLVRWGNIETDWLADALGKIEIKSPIFVCGLARSGTTIMTEVLASHKDVVTHQYKDYPFVHIPYLWNKLRMFIPTSKKKVERTHKDRIMINSESPEAMDEMIWNSFKDSSLQEFETFYKAHIKKLLFLRNGTRFVCKNNYNITRIKQLKAMFPDARFIIPVRSPQEVIASSIKQNALFLKVQEGDARSTRYAQNLGHYEFGQDFRPIDTGGDMDVIHEHWNKKEYAEAYANYWAQIHIYIEKEYADDPQVKIIKYDDLCENTAETLKSISQFCALPSDKMTIKQWSERISSPQYYKTMCSEEEQEKTTKITQFIKKSLWSKKT